jgi:hypothetical protein
LCPRNKQTQWIGLAHSLIASEWRHTDAHSLGSDGITDGIYNSQWETNAILNAAAVFVIPVVAVGLKLVRG